MGLMVQIEWAKGVGFVGTTAVLLYFFTRYLLRRVAGENHAVLRAR